METQLKCCLGCIQVHGHDFTCVASIGAGAELQDSTYRYISGSEEKMLRAFEAPQVGGCLFVAAAAAAAAAACDWCHRCSQLVLLICCRQHCSLPALLSACRPRHYLYHAPAADTPAATIVTAASPSPSPSPPLPLLLLLHAPGVPGGS